MDREKPNEKSIREDARQAGLSERDIDILIARINRALTEGYRQVPVIRFIPLPNLWRLNSFCEVLVLPPHFPRVVAVQEYEQARYCIIVNGKTNTKLDSIYEGFWYGPSAFQAWTNAMHNIEPRSDYEDTV